MKDSSSRLSCDLVEPDSSLWKDQVRRGLKSDEVRLRLSTYSILSTKCSESKEAQKQVGQLFNSNNGSQNGIVSPFAGSSLMNVLFDDLKSTDRTLRIATARALCLMAYENLTNQQLIMQSQAREEQFAVTVGWVHVFSVPQSLRDQYEAQCEERNLLTTPKGLDEFVLTLIKDNYASVYSRIGRYYAEGCREFLPLCWFHTLVNDSEATDLIDVPDPDENLIGFYLVPRQMQFPEQDDYFVQEMLSSIRSEAELLRLQQVQAAFQQVTFRARNKEANAAALKIALERTHNHDETFVDKEEERIVMNQRHRNVLDWLNAVPERMVTWNQLLIWCCTDMNAEEILKRYGSDVCSTLYASFKKLAFGSSNYSQLKDQTKAFVWEPAFVGVILEHPYLPDELKTNIRNFSCRYIKKKTTCTSSRNPTEASDCLLDEAFERPWEFLLPLELAEIRPMSWSFFLSKWRQIADGNFEEDDIHIYHQNGRRHHSVAEGANVSVLDVGTNVLVNNSRIFHSFRDLKQLRQQLPLITSRLVESNEEMLESPSGLRRLTFHQLNEAEERELKQRRKEFRRLQQSSADLDELTRQRLENKREVQKKAHENAAEKRKQAELLFTERQRELDRSRREKQAKAAVLSRRRENRWQRLIGARRERHKRAQWWKQFQLQAEIERQEEFMQKLHQNDAERREEERENAKTHVFRSNSESAVARMSTISLPRPPSTPLTNNQRLRRPLSARPATDPHIMRERAQLYGCAAATAFAARRPQTARADFYSGDRSVKQPLIKSRRPVRPASRKNSANVTCHFDAKSSTVEEMGTANACETLVMANATESIAHQIAIPPVALPAPEEDSVPPAIIMAQYLALEKEQRVKLHERYCVNRISHKLIFAVLQQLTQEMRQDAAWREFLKAAGRPPGVNNKRNKSKREAKVTYTAFATVATQLNISMPPKKLQGHMATLTDLSELEGGHGVWENIQEVLRIGFRDLWKAFAGVDSRILELNKALMVQKDDSQRQQQHLEAIAMTLNVMSEQLRQEQDETANQQIEMRLQNLESQLQGQLVKDCNSALDDSIANKASIVKAERRICLLEEEMEHIVSAIDQKVDVETLAEQGKRLQESIQQRQQQELENQVSVSFLELKTTQETLLQSEMASWAAKTQENVQLTIDQVSQEQTETLRAIYVQIQQCDDDVKAQQQRMDEFQAHIEKQTALKIAANREEIARQCSEAHGRIDFQFRTQEEVLERIQGDQRVLEEEIAAFRNKTAKQTGMEIAAAVEVLDRRVLDREHQEIKKLHRQLTEETQLTVENALTALKPAKEKEQRRFRQHQHFIARKLAEFDQMMQLIGRQLIQNTSQLQVVRNESLVHNFHLDDESDYDDNDLLLQYESAAQSSVLADVVHAPVYSGLQEIDQIEAGDSNQVAVTTQKDTAELQKRRSQHQNLQEQLGKKLRDYSEILDSNQQQTTADHEKLPPPKD